jgi:hypothetical protein
MNHDVPDDPRRTAGPGELWSDRIETEAVEIEGYGSYRFDEIDRTLAQLTALSSIYDAKFECPYCGKKLPDERAACCGEVGHAILAKDESE